VKMNFNDAGCFDASSQNVLLSRHVVFAAETVKIVQEATARKLTIIIGPCHRSYALRPSIRLSVCLFVCLMSTFNSTGETCRKQSWWNVLRSMR